MISKPDKNKLRQKRHRRVRGKLSGTADRPRLNIFRSNTGIYAQVIDDVAGVTLASASTLDKEVSKGTKTEQAVVVGKLGRTRTVAVLDLVERDLQSLALKGALVNALVVVVIQTTLSGREHGGLLVELDLVLLVGHESGEVNGNVGVLRVGADAEHLVGHGSGLAVVADTRADCEVLVEVRSVLLKAVSGVGGAGHGDQVAALEEIGGLIMPFLETVAQAENWFAYFGFYTLLIGISGVFWGVLALTVSAWVDNTYAIYIFPILFLYAMDYAAPHLHLYSLSGQMFAMYYYETWQQALLYPLVTFGSMSVLCYLAFIYRGRRNCRES